MVRFLLSQKVKVDTTTFTGYTPLHQAAQQGNSAIVDVLLDHGSSPDSKNNVSFRFFCKLHLYLKYEIFKFQGEKF